MRGVAGSQRPANETAVRRYIREVCNIDVRGAGGIRQMSIPDGGIAHRADVWTAAAAEMAAVARSATPDISCIGKTNARQDRDRDFRRRRTYFIRVGPLQRVRKG